MKLKKDVFRLMGCLNRYKINYKIIDDTCDENYIYYVPIFDWDFFNSLNNFKIEKILR